MPTATPDTIADVLAQIVDEAANQAAAQPDQLKNVIDQAIEQATQQAGQAVKEVTELPSQLLQQLKDAVDPPDWFSLLAFLLLRLSELDPRLHVGVLAAGAVHPPETWGRALTLTFREAPASFTIGFALTDPGTIRGLVVQASLPQPVSFGSAGLRLSIQGSGEWRIPFGGVALAIPDTSIGVTLSYDPGIHLHESGATFDLSPARLAAKLSSLPGAPIWSAEVGIGGDPPGSPGIAAGIDLRSALGALADIVHIQPIDESYAPTLALAAGTSPVFSLGHSSAG